MFELQASPWTWVDLVGQISIRLFALFYLKNLSRTALKKVQPGTASNKAFRGPGCHASSECAVRSWF